MAWALAVLPACGRSPAANPGGAASAATASVTPMTADQILARAREPGARATLVNVWASWCIPCREEFPDLMRIARGYQSRGLRVVLVSADFDTAAAKAFLASQKVRFPTYIKTGEDMAFIDRMNAKWTGAIPATFLYDSSGRAVAFWEGQADYHKFEQATLEAMNAPAPTP
jgi:thiol-disulfide isomerase/thioredoxin